MKSVSKLLVQEFYANAAIFDEEAAEQEELPYKSFVRGVKVDFSPSNIRRVMRFKREIAGEETDYKTHATNPYRFVSTPTSASDQVVPLTSGYRSHEERGCNLDKVNTRKLGLGVVSGESPRLSISAKVPRLVYSRLGVGAGA
ncbi:hypothetical protein PIB30_096219 [Stylosanthes scabra]|uniref:Uncharacterized protein n=1 Tax=Stylosanthes scabra TaxID=79078 RepID=A0ABU6TVI0_9FABA|nr:hypothetical protein [Stylosanthes scabra]